VLVDERSNLLWVCSNDMSGKGVPGPSSIPGRYLKRFDLSTGEGKISAALPGSRNLCNDMAAPQILRLKLDQDEPEVFLEDKQFVFFRIEMHEGRPGKVMKLTTSRPLKFPDGLRPLSGETFLMVEGGGTLDRVSIEGDKVARGSFLIFSIRPPTVRRDYRSFSPGFRWDRDVSCTASP
jgi:hypothetical protein